MKTELFALYLVTYPACNEGYPCRQVVAFGSFDDIYSMAEQVSAREAADHEGSSAPDDVMAPAWDYFCMDPEA